ncbi:MAG: ATP phosphoribosyltransferase regulatory subunit [Clostridia bacterium]|nr:ATP phosphoribosyltransferase regulatory subunit [Clostridia bacterium]
MNIDYSVFKNDEKAIFELRSLYQKYGYSQFKMSKFEEYDLYVRNKDFLVSDNVITFTDTNGKLMALKPDVTLSIIKNSEDVKNSVQKLYYNENVYRVSKGTLSFKEIMQVGLECIGDVDDYCIYEVLMLAAESLKNISEDYVLDISQLDIVSSLIDELNVSGSAKAEIVKCIGEKNIHGINKICEEAGADCEKLKKLVLAYGDLETVMPVLNEIKTEETKDAVNQLVKVVSALENSGYKGKIRIDFSVINDMNYYNGFVFKGFIYGIASGILSGGQYIKLMKKMGRKSGAIGFAVYLDMLERLSETEKKYDVDTVILYDENSDLTALNDAINMLTANGNSVLAEKTVPEKINYKQLLKLQERGVEIIENNA